MADGVTADTNETVEALPTVRIEAEIEPSLTYASFQNAVPVLRRVRLSVEDGETRSSLQLHLRSEPPFLREKIWRIDRLGPDGLELADRRVELDPAYLARLDEAERGEAQLELRTGETVLATLRHPVRLLARDEWGGASDMAQLLPAFAMPNDPAVARLLRAAAERLGEHGHATALDGYQSGDPARSYMLAAAIYAAIADLGLHYAEPPKSFETSGQKVRRPSTITTEGLATCLDTALLLAAALEAVGLNAVLVLTDGHALAGAWLRPQTLPRLVETDRSEVRKALAARELMLFETTGLTHRPPLGVEAARQEAARQLDEGAARSFTAAVDIARARSAGIMPLASHESRPDGDAADAEPALGALPLPPLPDASQLPAAQAAEAKPTTPAGRIDRWQSRLLDLSLRNRLLNFTLSASTVPFLCPDAAFLEDRLAGGHGMRIVSIPAENPVGQRDETLFRQTRGEDRSVLFAREALARDELASPLDGTALDARLTALYRQARNDLAEGGTNTLFVAVGFLRWRKQPEDERTYRAPLLLLPARLERRSASAPFRLVHHEDEVRFNATLLQFLERDFRLAVPGLSGELPTDEKGIDVAAVLERMRQAVREAPGFEVVDEAALGTFSFAKYLMWKDLTERTDALRQNRVVRHLLDTPEQPFPDTVAFRAPREVDRAFEPASIVTPLPADSSQIVASLAAAEGKDFVIVGPPGTGKSQTIANMIAHCLANRRTVLFVAEKTAALEVVYRRLCQVGLGDHCLELHSSKADRRHFLRQLRNAWENGGERGGEDWIAINGRLRVKRDELNRYANALHAPAANGLTAYRAMGLTLRGSARHAPALRWGSPDAHDAAGLTELEELATVLGRTFAAVGSRPELRWVERDDWSSAWQEALLAAARTLRETTVTLADAAGALARALDAWTEDGLDFERIDQLRSLADAVAGISPGDAALAVDRNLTRWREAVEPLAAEMRSFHADEVRLSARYDRDELARVPVDDLDRRWREAKSSIWPISILSKRGAARLLATYAASGTPDPEVDLPLLRRLQASRAQIERSPLSTLAPVFAGLDTDPDALRARLDAAQRLQDAVARIAPDGGSGARLRLELADGTPLRRAAAALAVAVVRFAEAERQFTAWSHGSAPSAEPGATPTSVEDTVRAIEEGRGRLRDWSTWSAVRRRALSNGLQPLVEAIEEGSVAPDEAASAFRLAYARWWLPLAIDADATLRDFRRFSHEHAIEDFRALDDLARAAAGAHVHAAIRHDLPDTAAVPRKSELGLLRHQMELKRPSRSIREMIAGMPDSFPQLAPCLLMSPLSIAQYLPPTQAPFDVVIFDEASQITTWDAVGAIARARQTVIVGDPKQLPPTNFFGRNEAEDDETADHERDLESILDEARASGLPVHHLRWHYRSRHESLIAFSNHHYYENRLITFPSPVTEDRAVSLRHLPGAVYDRGKSRTNRDEARAIAADLASRLREALTLPDARRPTFGVITFNAQQQALIQDLLDDERRADPEIEWFFADERLEPVFVKNLENVQGDERDVILFSITFGRDSAGKLAMDFGALNREGGERRLNVAVTRARTELLAYSALKADQIDLSRTKSAGVRDLKTFLDYADRGAAALPSADVGSQGEPDSPFEEAVMAALRDLGWRCVPQVGVSGFRVDIGIPHPDRPGAYLAGVECDGATYHRSATARDRDKVREEVLRGLGWQILRVWSTDWWFDPEGAAKRLHGGLEAMLATDRAQRSADATADQT
ncbi:DUF4011 domain-containing protein [Aureimonas jatrophae]|uniref:Part of AAA domain-containing protein n=1 Tax=Aureimonas jatrophae TaxID=1166073 RepID=A0A1H0C8E8_9HYPH|nr:DUF4011 domain-containing protein [Aureimonas jatrophae]MBB3949113.1 hypothetical protein [Aureimonas jatrophae]SDN54112.1 Part of AAA domain-containing protein [Aureimonas jatrophae]